ncbi:hypothetical protein FBQ87_14250 [Sphingobacteriales bacterium CHB3]|nr:hypothetical protein [Sphingobacteriales bacterium CHB3]
MLRAILLSAMTFSCMFRPIMESLSSRDVTRLRCCCTTARDCCTGRSQRHSMCLQKDNHPNGEVQHLCQQDRLTLSSGARK